MSNLILAAELTNAARSADANVIGIAILRPEREPEPGWHVYTRPDGARLRVDTANGNQPNPAAVAAIYAYVPPSAAARIKSAAAAALADASSESAQRDRAVALAAADEINTLRAWLAALKTAVGAATSLADLKARVSALDATPQLTAAQVRAAVAARIESNG